MYSNPSEPPAARRGPDRCADSGAGAGENKAGARDGAGDTEMDEAAAIRAFLDRLADIDARLAECNRRAAQRESVIGRLHAETKSFARVFPA